jgi:hypothetical protein
MKLIDRLKSHPAVKSDSTIGVVSSFGKGAEVDIKSDTRDIVVIANTNDIDLESEVVVAAGADTSYFVKNGHIFADHVYDIANGAGKLRSLSPYPSKTDHKAWKVRARINDNPIGNAIKTIVEQTGQIGVSIGFMAKDFGQPNEDEMAIYGVGDKLIRSIVRTWDWFELSFTLLPCNVSCQSMATVEGKSLDMMNAVDRMVTKGLFSREIASTLGAPISPKRKIYTVPVPKPRYLVTEDGDTVLMRA